MKRIYKNKPSALHNATFDSMYQLVAILTIVNYAKRVTLGNIYLYLWALRSDENAAKMQYMHKHHIIYDIPWHNEEIEVLISQCLLNDLLRIDTKSEGFYVLGTKALEWKSEIETIDLYQELMQRCQKMGLLCNNTIRNSQMLF